MLARTTNFYILILKAISGKYRIHNFRQGKEIHWTATAIALGYVGWHQLAFGRS